MLSVILAMLEVELEIRRRISSANINLSMIPPFPPEFLIAKVTGLMNNTKSIRLWRQN